MVDLGIVFWRYSSFFKGIDCDWGDARSNDLTSKVSESGEKLMRCP